MSPTNLEQPYLPPQIQESPPQPRPTRVRIVVSLLLCIAAAAAYVCRNSIAACQQLVREDLGLSEKAMGVILGPAFFWSYALAQIPTGWLGEKLGARRCLPLYAITWSLACAMIAWPESLLGGTFLLAAGFPLLFTSRFIGGLAQAGLFPCSTKAVSHWHPPTERALASGAITACMQIGGTIGVIGVGVLLSYMPWRWIFVLYALPGILWAVVFWWWFRETPAEHRSVNTAELARIAAGPTANSKSLANPSQPPKPRSERDVWLALFTSPAAWLIFTQQFFRAAGYAFFASWFAEYLQKTRGISTQQSALLTSLPLIAMVVSSVFGGGLSDFIYGRTGSLEFSRKGLSAITQLLCAAIVFSAYFVHDANLAVLVISLGIFCSGFAGPCAYAITIDMGGRNVAPFFSTMNMMGNIGAGLLPMLVPWFKDWIDAHPRLLALSNGNSWHAVLVLFAAMYLASAVCWMLLRTDRNVYDQSLWKGKAAP